MYDELIKMVRWAVDGDNVSLDATVKVEREREILWSEERTLWSVL